MAHLTPVTDSFLDRIRTGDVQTVYDQLRNVQSAIDPNLEIVPVVAALAERPEADFRAIVHDEVLPRVEAESPLAHMIAEGVIIHWIDSNSDHAASGFIDPNRNAKQVPIGGIVFYTMPSTPQGKITFKILFSNKLMDQGYIPGVNAELAAWRGVPGNMIPEDIRNAYPGLFHLIENNQGVNKWARSGEGHVKTREALSKAPELWTPQDRRYIRSTNQIKNIDYYVATFLLPTVVGPWEMWPNEN